MFLVQALFYVRVQEWSFRFAALFALYCLPIIGADTYVPMVGLFRGSLLIFSIGGIGVRGHAMWALPECAYSGRGSI